MNREATGGVCAHGSNGFWAILVEPMGRSERRQWRRLMFRALLLDGQAQVGATDAAADRRADEQGLNQFLNQSPWGSIGGFSDGWPGGLADEGAEPVYWVLDETSFPKAGEFGRRGRGQYCGALGKIATAQVAVACTWSRAK